MMITSLSTWALLEHGEFMLYTYTLTRSLTLTRSHTLTHSHPQFTYSLFFLKCPLPGEVVFPSSDPVLVTDLLPQFV